MKKILVHCHVYYQDMWPELRTCVANIPPYPYDLYVTIVEENEQLRQDILSFKPDAHILLIENRGFDVGPFVHVLNQVDLDSYDYVAKLHTKRDAREGTRVNGYNVGGSMWRRYLCSFIKTRDDFVRCLKAFESDNQLGMIANHRLISSHSDNDKSVFGKSSDFMKRMGLTLVPLRYVAGTIFMMRASLLKPFLLLGLTLQDFEVSVRNSGASLGHVCERVLGWIVVAQGYQIKDCITSSFTQRMEYVCRPIRKIGSFLYRSKKTASGKHVIKICKIPMYVRGE